MKITEHTLWDLITKDISGAISETEKQQLSVFLQDNPQMAETYEILSRIEPVINTTDPEEEKDDIKQITFQKIFSNSSRKSARIRTIPYLIGIAALFLLTLTFGYQTYKLSRVSDIEVNTPKGVYSKVELPDGTTVFLNSGSKMIYPARFSGKERAVKLWGEGFFDVKKDKAPFIVSSQRIRVKVLGTAFNFRNYPSDSIGVVTLERGSVQLSLVNHNQKILMQPKDQVVLNKRNSEFVVRKNIDPNDYSSWKDGEFIFKSISFPELCNNLERRYNYTFVINTRKYDKETFTGKFKYGESIQQIMEVIKLNTPIQYKFEKDSVIIY